MKTIRGFLFLFIFLCLALPALASTSVLVPQESISGGTTSSSSPYLPKSSTSTPSSPQKTAPMTRTGPSLEETILKTSRGGSRNRERGDLKAKIDEMIKARDAAISRDPLIIDEMVPPSFEDPRATVSLLVKLDGKPLWGKQDISQIKRSFGYTEEEAVKNCQLRLSLAPMTQSGKLFLNRDVLPGDQVVVKHDGKLKEIEIQPQALCLAPINLPRNGSVLTRINAKILGIPLMRRASCKTTGTADPSRLTIKFKGDGNVLCAFQ